ncbi:MAG: hypothetical protein ACLUMK_05910 [Christensenellales bacterium]
MALVTDAGTPCISDPGSFLAKECRRSGSRCWRCRADGDGERAFRQRV